MAKEPHGDQTHANRRQTQYEPHGRPETTHGFVRSAWSLVAAVIVLALILSMVWMYWPEGHTNPAPVSSPGQLPSAAPLPRPGSP